MQTYPFTLLFGFRPQQISETAPPKAPDLNIPDCNAAIDVDNYTSNCMAQKTCLQCYSYLILFMPALEFDRLLHITAASVKLSFHLFTIIYTQMKQKELIEES